MKIAFDLDGVIAEGKFVALPLGDTHERMQHYMQLQPYDVHTAGIFNQLCQQHEVTIVTSRHEFNALHQITVWLHLQGMRAPHSIITHCDPLDKGAVCRALNIDLFFDDHPEAFQAGMKAGVFSVLVNNPGWDLNQQLEIVTNARCYGWQHIAQIVEDLA